MELDRTIFMVGAMGMLGEAVMRRLKVNSPQARSCSVFLKKHLPASGLMEDDGMDAGLIKDVDVRRNGVRELLGQICKDIHGDDRQTDYSRSGMGTQYG